MFWSLFDEVCSAGCGSLYSRLGLVIDSEVGLISLSWLLALRPVLVGCAFSEIGITFGSWRLVLILQKPRSRSGRPNSLIYCSVVNSLRLKLFLILPMLSAANNNHDNHQNNYDACPYQNRHEITFNIWSSRLDISLFCKKATCCKWSDVWTENMRLPVDISSDLVSGLFSCVGLLNLAQVNCYLVGFEASYYFWVSYFLWESLDLTQILEIPDIKWKVHILLPENGGVGVHVLDLVVECLESRRVYAHDWVVGIANSFLVAS